jgi:hypothetical protein
MSSSVRKTQYIAGSVRITYNIDDYNFNIFNKTISPPIITSDIRSSVIGYSMVSEEVIFPPETPSFSEEDLDLNEISNSFTQQISGFSTVEYINEDYP